MVILSFKIPFYGKNTFRSVPKTAKSVKGSFFDVKGRFLKVKRIF